MRIAIVEDEQEYYKKLLKYIKEYEAENKESCEVKWFQNGIEFVDNYKPNFELILMDIEMPYMNGIEAAKEIRTIDQTVLLIFITNMAQYAIKGYEVEALDYVLKPLSYYAFAMKLKKASRIIRERNQNRILLPFEEENKLIFEKDILYVEITSHKMQFHTYEGISTMTGTLKAIEKKLTPGRFVRCNNCFLINLSHVSGVVEDHVLIEGEKLKISRPKKKQFLEKLAEYYGGGGR